MTNDAADLLAVLFADEPPNPTPANLAISANHEDWRGLPADSEACDSLRLSAIRPEKSQPIAEQSQSADGPESEACRGNSQKSQESQGVPDLASARLAQRRGDFMRQGFPAAEAEGMAARLMRRDEERDDRAFCLECSELSKRGRCLAAVRLVEPVPNILVRCGAFKAKALLSQEGSRIQRKDKTDD